MSKDTLSLSFERALAYKLLKETDLLSELENLAKFRGGSISDLDDHRIRLALSEHVSDESVPVDKSDVEESDGLPEAIRQESQVFAEKSIEKYEMWDGSNEQALNELEQILSSDSVRSELDNHDRGASSKARHAIDTLNAQGRETHEALSSIANIGYLARNNPEMDNASQMENLAQEVVAPFDYSDVVGKSHSDNQSDNSGLSKMWYSSIENGGRLEYDQSTFIEVKRQGQTAEAEAAYNGRPQYFESRDVEFTPTGEVVFHDEGVALQPVSHARGMETLEAYDI